MMVDQDRLKAMAEELVELRILQRLSGFDSGPYRALIRFLREFYAKLPPDLIEGSLAVVASPTAPTELPMRGARTPRDGLLEDVIRFPAVIHLLGDGDFKVWNNVMLSTHALSSPGCLIYLLTDSEQIWVDGHAFTVPMPSRQFRSAFATPSFWSLDSALDDYRKTHARGAIGSESCWLDDQRLRWATGPESALRDALWLYLRTVLRGVTEVQMEQRVDKSNPVDIKVTWNLSRARALIEIKWLGASFDWHGNCTACYTNFRAKRGAVQLRNYVTSFLQRNPDLRVVGYLVVFDGRRKKVRDFHAKVTYEDAWAYEHAHIEQPAILRADKRLRLDYRLFVEPALKQDSV